MTAPRPRPLAEAAMQIAAEILVGLVALLHVWFLVLEMFLWDKPLGLKTFRQTPESAAVTKVLAANQGLYNGFLAAGLFWGLGLGATGFVLLLVALRAPAREATAGLRTEVGRVPVHRRNSAAGEVAALLDTAERIAGGVAFVDIASEFVTARHKAAPRSPHERLWE